MMNSNINLEDIEKLVELFTENYDDFFDPDGTKYFLALDYIKERSIDSKDMEALEKLGDEIDQRQMSLLQQMKKAKDDSEKEQLKTLFSELSDIHVGLLSIMINQHDGDFLA